MSTQTSEHTVHVSSAGPVYRTVMRHPYEAHGATDNGDWWDAKDLERIIAEVTIATTATVAFRGSNAVSEPAAATHGYEIATALTASGKFTLEGKDIPRWIKFYISAWTAGAVDVDCKLTERVGNDHNSTYTPA